MVVGGAVVANETEQVEDVQETPAGPTKRGGRGLLRLIKAVAFVSVLVVVQIVVASILVPSASETERLAHDLAAASKGEDHSAGTGHDAESSHGDHGEGVKEVDLGTYNITRYNPTTNTTLAIDFELYGTVLAEEAAEFSHRFEASTARIREQVTMTLHAAESTDLTDAGLGLIKRQILEKTNRALGRPFLKEVLFSKFNFVER
jgi:flagellar FliL protein